MTLFIMIVHSIVCFGLIVIVLVQRGRGSGLVESFQGIESMFGTKTNVFLTRSTTVLSTLFFITCLSLAVLSLRQSKSLMIDVKPKKGASVKEVVPKQQDAPELPAAATTPAAATASASATSPSAEKSAAETKTQAKP